MALNETPNGRPYWAIALALVVGVAVLVTAGVMLSSRFRTPVGVQPAPSISISGSPARVAANQSQVAPAQGSHANQTDASETLKKEVEQAYLHYWDVYVQEAAKGDTALLSQVLSGDALQWTTDEIAERKAQGRGVVLKVTHLSTVRNLTTDSAEVDDQYTDASQWTELATGNLLPRQGPPKVVVQTFQMRLVDGSWKVVGGTRDELG